MIHEVCVKEIRLGDVADPEIYVAKPIYDWEHSSAGKFIMEHSKKQPIFRWGPDYIGFGFLCQIFAWLDDEDLTYWSLTFKETQ